MSSHDLAGPPEGARGPAATVRLEGRQATVEFDGRHCVIRYPFSGRWSVLRALNGRPIPLSALARVILTPPAERSGWGFLRLVPRPGADAVSEVLGAQPPDSVDPYLIRFHRRELAQARRVHGLLTEAIGRLSPPSVGGRLPLSVPSPPRRLRAVHSTVEFDGRVIRATGGAHHGADGSARVVPLCALDGVSYIHRHPELGPLLRLHLPGAGPSFADPLHDPDTLVLNALREAENVLFAASLLEALSVSASSPVMLRMDHAGQGQDEFTAHAELDGQRVGTVLARTPAGAPHIREIAQLHVAPSTGISRVRGVEDALLKAVLRWAYGSGAEYLTVARDDGRPGRGDLYRRHGFGRTVSRAPGESVPCLALRPYAAHRADVLSVLGDVSPRRGRRKTAGCGTWALGFFVFFALVLIGGAYQLTEGPRVAGLPVGFLAMALLITVLVWPLVRAALRARELTQATDAPGVIREDPRPPVLYLRSFRDDETARKPTRIGSFATEEESVATAMTGIGPFIGLDQEIQVLGAAKAKVADEDWRDAVTTLLSRCQLAVMRCGAGDSLYWELEQSVLLLRPEQLVILIPRDRKLYEGFRQRAAGILPHALPPLPAATSGRRPLVAAIRFSDGWLPRLIPLRLPFLLRFLSLESCLAFRLLPELREFHYRRSVFWQRRVLFFLFVTAGVYLLLGRGLPLMEALTNMMDAGDDVRREWDKITPVPTLPNVGEGP
ncbi:GNAT family N-acetyltransferase [Streptomyces asiaticus]|uniref:GNAT family N-acetyltransferase n=1 Tax=Streptomyces asiaticus TaxID=114695 RepID=UPI003D73D349